MITYFKGFGFKGYRLSFSLVVYLCPHILGGRFFTNIHNADSISDVHDFKGCKQQLVTSNINIKLLMEQCTKRLSVLTFTGDIAYLEQIGPV